MTVDRAVKARDRTPGSRGTDDVPRDVARLRHATAGLIAAVVALGAGELTAGVLGTRSSPVIVVGNRVIDGVPRAVKDWAIDVFGTGDKVALLVGIHSLLAVAALGVGVLAAHRFALAAVAFAVFALTGALAGLGEHDAGAAETVPSLVAGGAGMATLWMLVRTARSTDERRDAPKLENRRAFLVAIGAAVAVAGSAGTLGRFLQSRISATASRLGVRLPNAAEPLPPLPAEVELGVAGVSPFITRNEDFYRIDVNLVAPQVQADTWTLRVLGMVDRELEITYDELLDRPMVEADLTLACVSNEVGDDLVGNARWLGTPLLDLLEEAGIRPGADQVVGRAVDHFTVGFPVTALRDGRTALVAVGMNGEPLPVEHGFPVRLVVAGLYGYVSATKWLEEIELSTFAEYDTYWARRGWARRAPVKTMSRIDTPRAGSRLREGSVAVGGVAWAPTRAVDRVEVRIDDGNWSEAELGAVPGDDTWRQWVHRWEAVPGDHRITVRATDGAGDVQPEQEVPPFPDGATGWHTVRVSVSSDE